MYRTLILIGKLTRKFNPLLTRLWDAALQGIKTSVTFKGLLYLTVQTLQGMEVRIVNPVTRDLLGKVVGGELFQCA